MLDAFVGKRKLKDALSNVLQDEKYKRQAVMPGVFYSPLFLLLL